MEPIDNDRRILRTRSTRRRAELDELILVAADLWTEISEGAEGFEVSVASVDAERAQAELDAYERENPARVAAPPAATDGTHGLVGAIAFALLMTTAAMAQRGAYQEQMLAHGSLSPETFTKGEFWRVLTALTLHADPAHFISNLVFGVVFVGLAADVGGAGRAVFATIAAGGAANLLNAALRGGDWSAIGASTAVFAALGFLGAVRVEAKADGGGWARRFMPLGAAVLLFILFGGGDGRVDVLGHALGLIAGVVFGFAHRLIWKGRGVSATAEAVLVFLALASLVIAWVFALFQVTDGFTRRPI